MILHINKSPVSFQLDQEKNLGEVLTALRLWTAGQGFILSSVLVDGREASSLSDDTAVEGIGVIEMEAHPHEEDQSVQLEVVADFFQLAFRAAEARDEKALRDLQNEYVYLRPSLYRALGSLSPRLGDDLVTLEGDWRPGKPSRENLDRIRSALSELLLERKDPKTFFFDTLHSLPELFPQLRNLGTLLQKGQDKVAMDLILGLLSRLEDLNRRGALLGKMFSEDAGFHWEDFSRDLNRFLKEVETALQARDFVLLADLMEYEIVPRLETLASRKADSP